MKRERDGGEEGGGVTQPKRGRDGEAKRGWGRVVWEATN